MRTPVITMRLPSRRPIRRRRRAPGSSGRTGVRGKAPSHAHRHPGRDGPAGTALGARLASVGYEVVLGSRSRYRAMEARDDDPGRSGRTGSCAIDAGDNDRRRRGRPGGHRHAVGLRGDDRARARTEPRRQGRRSAWPTRWCGWVASSSRSSRPGARWPPTCRRRCRTAGSSPRSTTCRRSELGHLDQPIESDVLICSDDTGRHQDRVGDRRAPSPAAGRSTPASCPTPRPSRPSRPCCSSSTSATAPGWRRSSPASRPERPGSRGRTSAMSMRLFDTARQEVVPFEPGPVVTHLHVRHHALRRHPPRPRHRLPVLRRAAAPPARPRPRHQVRAQRHRRRRPAVRQGPRARRALPRPGGDRGGPVRPGHGRPRRPARLQPPRASSAIPDIRGFIGMVLDRGFAYQAGGSVYFDVSRFPTVRGA